MTVITLTPEQHACWVAAVAEWPTCETCNALGYLHNTDRPHTFIDCPDCVAGRVPQPVVLVIKGDPCGRCRERIVKHTNPHVRIVCDNIQEPRAWRVPAGEPVELRATDPAYYSAPHHFTVLVARATVELQPVVKGKVSDLPCIMLNGQLDVLPFRLSDAVPGRHWVAICKLENAS